jgi:hypothetical protein
MARIMFGTVLVVWAIVVFLSNDDFLDGFLFPVVTMSVGVNLILAGREGMLGHSFQSSDAGSVSSPATTAAEPPTRSGSFSKLVTNALSGIAVSVVSGVILHAINIG